MKTLEQELDEILLPRGWRKESIYNSSITDTEIFYQHHSDNYAFVIHRGLQVHTGLKGDIKDGKREVISPLHIAEYVKDMPFLHKHTEITQLHTDNFANLIKIITNLEKINQELVKLNEKLRNANRINL